MRSETQLRQTIAHIVCDMEKVASGGTAAWRELLMRVAVAPLRRALEAPEKEVPSSIFGENTGSYADPCIGRFQQMIICPFCGDCHCCLEEVEENPQPLYYTKEVTLSFSCCHGLHFFDVKIESSRGLTGATLSGDRQPGVGSWVHQVQQRGKGDL